MQSRSNTIIGAGVAVAVLGALMVFVYAHSLRGTAGAASGPSASAYVATAAIASGTKGDAITASIKQASVPTAARPADAVTAVSQLTGLAANRNINPGEVITTSEFGAAGAPSSNTGGLAIPAGHNAITVTAPVAPAVAGYVSAGDQVNVFMTTAKDNPSARLLLSNVTVLAIVPANTPVVKTATGTVTAAPVSGDTYFTLSLTPVDAEKVIFAQTFDSLYYGLVHPGDGPATTAGQTPTSLFK